MYKVYIYLHVTWKYWPRYQCICFIDVTFIEDLRNKGTTVSADYIRLIFYHLHFHSIVFCSCHGIKFILFSVCSVYEEYRRGFAMYGKYPRLSSLSERQKNNSNCVIHPCVITFICNLPKIVLMIPNIYFRGPREICRIWSLLESISEGLWRDILYIAMTALSL